MDLGGLTPEQQIRLSDLLRWFETVGKHLRPVNQRPQERASPVPMFLGKATSTITSTGGTAQFWSSTAASTVAETATGSSATVYSWLGQNIASGDEVLIFRHYRSGRLYSFNGAPTLDLPGFTTPTTDANALIPVYTSAGWTYKTPTQYLALLTGYNGSNDQSIGHDASGTPEWQDDEEC